MTGSLVSFDAVSDKFSIFLLTIANGTGGSCFGKDYKCAAYTFRIHRNVTAAEEIGNI